MYKSFIDTLERAGIILPQWLYVVFVIFIIMFGLEIIWKKFLKEKVEIIIKTHKNVNNLEDFNLQLQAEIKRASEADKQIVEEISAIKNGISSLISEIDDLKEKNDLHEQAALKDRICQAYTYYHRKGSWNSMEKESLECLIKSYEATKNGANSFVHSVVVPEMYTWEIKD